MSRAEAAFVWRVSANDRKVSRVGRGRVIAEHEVAHELLAEIAVTID